MEKSTRIILLALVVLTLASLIFNVFSVNKNLRESLKLVKESQQELTLARKEITISKNQIDSMQTQFQVFGNYVKDIQERVHILDLERRANDVDFRLKKDSIKILLDSLYNIRGIEGGFIEPKEFKN